MTSTGLLWTILGVAVIGGGAFFAALNFWFRKRHPEKGNPTPVNQQQSSNC